MHHLILSSIYVRRGSLHFETPNAAPILRPRPLPKEEGDEMF